MSLSLATTILPSSQPRLPPPPSQMKSPPRHQNHTLGNNRDIAFERSNDANNMGTERVTLPKSIYVRSTGFIYKQQQRHRATRAAKMVKFLKTNKDVIILQGKYAGHKAVIVESFDNGTRYRAYDHYWVVGIKKYPSKVNQAVSGNVSNNGGGRGSVSSNSSRSCVASQLDQLVSESYMQMQQRVSKEEIDVGITNMWLLDWLR
uniref:KOW domain-containing protein n=1 Tax=Salix viminalis TaxID=40686 RepID=A0A6N2KSN0_SALVM